MEELFGFRGKAGRKLKQTIFFLHPQKINIVAPYKKDSGSCYFDWSNYSYLDASRCENIVDVRVAYITKLDFPGNR